MDDKLVVAVLAGTKRAKRLSIQAAEWVADFGRSLPNVEIIFVDPEDFDFPGDGNDPEGKDPKYTAITAKADAFFIVTPEYNHSYPGTLKRMIDSELGNYIHKPLMIAGVSDGEWGGVRAVESLLSFARTVGFSAIMTNLYFPEVQNIFDGQGNMHDEFKDRYTKNTQKAYDELLWMARALKYARNTWPRIK